MNENSIESSTKQGSVDQQISEFDILQELGSIGAGNAATALSEILQQPIKIELPKIYTLPPHLIQDYYNYHDNPVTAVYSQLRGEFDCDILLIFDRDEEKKIVALMNMIPPEEVMPETAASTIEELGNMLIGAFWSAISNFIGVELVPSPPQRATDSFDAIIDYFLIKQALFTSISLVFETRFLGAQGAGNCILIVFLSRELYRMLIEKAKEWLQESKV